MGLERGDGFDAIIRFGIILIGASRV
jgi:hypothetical protein